MLVMVARIFLNFFANIPLETSVRFEHFLCSYRYFTQSKMALLDAHQSLTLRSFHSQVLVRLGHISSSFVVLIISVT